MTVKELIKELQKLPENDKIYFNIITALFDPKPVYDTCLVYEEDKEDPEDYGRPAGSVIALG